LDGPPTANLFGQQRLRSAIADLIGPGFNILISTVSGKFAEIGSAGPKCYAVAGLDEPVVKGKCYEAHQEL